MIKKIVHKIKSLLEHQAVVLMYHRVAEPESDVWEIAVSPANFEQQLRVLKEAGCVVPLQQLLHTVRTGALNKNSIAITFDDGYVDNYTTAVPLLKKYQLPATFFIASGNSGKGKAFWWDELEYHILFSERLPSTLAMTVANTEVVQNLEEEALLSEELRRKHTCWKACEEEPPTTRAHLFYKLWELIRPLPQEAQQQELQKIRNWVGSAAINVPGCESMSLEQLQEINDNPLFSIEAHTVSHPALAFHNVAYQRQELLDNITYLNAVTGKEASILAYPYGNYNSETLTVAASLNVKAAFTTEERPVRKGDDFLRLGRFQVKNNGAKEFSRNLRCWMRDKH